MDIQFWKKLGLAFILMFTAHTLSWFQMNSQFIWQWWKERPMLSILIFSYPIAFLFYFGIRYSTGIFESMWASRLLGFGISFLSFPFLTYFFYKESMFEPRTLVCIFLSLIIVLVQAFWR